MNFKLVNNLTGWISFFIAAAVYILTLEPTASFWDCGEFIAVSYKLMVPHPPGAPLFLLIGRMFSFLAMGDVTQVAYWINMVSALSSAFTILFLFWTITMLARRIVAPNVPQSQVSGLDTFKIIGAGLVGALAFTFSDSFWFSAVEAEVYALSSLFTAIVYWAMLRWEEVADEPGADRWLLLIAYSMGLSIGVHLLNLLAIPALAYIYYFKRYKRSQSGMIATFLVSVLILGIIQVGIIPGLPSIAGKIELLLVNAMSMPFGSGIIVFMIALVAALVYGIVRSEREKRRELNLALLGLVFVLIGYCSYGIIVIRANNAPPINENNPSDVVSFVSYLKREQYGDRPLLSGPAYNSRSQGQKKGDPIYMKGEKKYETIGFKYEPDYPSSEKVLLPRIYSPQQSHIAAYKNWVDLKDPEKKPTLAQNLGFMFRYQIGWMYMRYLMWNFAGRESDIQNASWLAPLDSNEGLPASIANNKARNNFFMIPFVLGIIGFTFQLMRNGRNAFITGLLFFFTGVAIVIYLNQPPTEPRERDYTFTGSFYVFCIWIGLAVLAIADWIQKYVSPKLAGVVATLIGLLAPTIMGAVGWDDHDRSGRYHSVDSAKNLLASCAPNAILFTGGDNDTFPLWYVQEVEGFRTDVRVCNLSLLGTDWYIQQMKQQAYESAPLPISLDFANFVQGKNDYLMLQERITGPVNLKQYMKLVKEDNPQIMLDYYGQRLNFFPSKTFSIDVDTAAVANAGWIAPENRGRISGRIDWNPNKQILYKPDLIMLDILANNNWQRPIYFSTTLGNSSYLNLREYFQLEGLAYRLTPVYNQGAAGGVVNTDVMYKNMMQGMFWRNLNDSSNYYDENYRRFPLNSRNSFYRLAEALANQGDMKRCGEVVDYCFKIMPDAAIPYDPYTPQFVPLLKRMGREKEGKEIIATMAKRAEDELNYYSRLDNPSAFANEANNNLYILYNLSQVSANIGDNATAERLQQSLQRFQGLNSMLDYSEE